MPNAVLVDIVRSPMGRGKSGGSLASTHPVELLSQVLKTLVTRSGIDPGEVDDVIVGCVGQISEQAATPGRQAWLSAGFPISVPSTTIDRRCGSGQQAIDFAVQGVMAGAYEVVIAGGLESMSHIPMGKHRLGADPEGPGVHARFPNLVRQGIAAELIADKYGLSRTALDTLSAESHARAHAAQSQGLFDPHLVPVTRPDGEVVHSDETIRPGTTAEILSGLTPAFATDEMRAQFPELEWKITAGNSSQITDGAGAALIMSEERAARLNLNPRARVVASTAVGSDPVLMLTGVIPATHKVLDRAKLSIDEINQVEVNEAFASVPLAWHCEFPIDGGRLNRLGGAIALGHPLGASGLRLLSSLLTTLATENERYGLQTMCEAGGMANAMIIERL
ncbi:thiolase family protein [Rhodococcus opacus]|uniref:Steroid 3-ketoacyl-CoA thiolase n=1 Tax=Rhodococcus opacus TaxID=37919 RepID=A0A2S8J8R5_RHOOP|nr:thiolase family protein [Rhodococcus opacus]PQP23395.1 steroid 3-ketoacyl-CoA thiolase [Rhodococcus opacus]